MSRERKKNPGLRILTGFVSLILGLLLFIDLVMILELNGVRQTIMNPAFIEAELQKAEIYSLVKEQLEEQKDEFVGELGAEGERLYNVVDQSLSEEWLQSQVHDILTKFYSYLTGETDDLNIAISLDGLKENLKLSLRQSIHEDTPEGLQALSAEELDEYLELAYEGLDDLPQAIGVKFSSLQPLEPMRDLLRGFDLIFYILVALGVLFALLLAFLHLRVRSITRVLGIPLLLSGGLVYAIGRIGVGLASSRIEAMDLPSFISADTMMVMVKDFLAAPNFYAFVFMGVGAGLIVLSFAYRESRRPAPTPRASAPSE